MTIRQYWVAYDISDNQERAKVERCVSRYGQRLQKSLFVCVLDQQRRKTLQADLEGLQCQTGTIAIAALQGDPAKTLFLGQMPPQRFAENWAFTVFSGPQAVQMLGGDPQ